MSRLQPKSTEEAFSHQFEDCAKLLRRIGSEMRFGSEKGRGDFQRQLRILKDYIAVYESTVSVSRAMSTKELKGFLGSAINPVDEKE